MYKFFLFIFFISFNAISQESNVNLSRENQLKIDSVLKIITLAFENEDINVSDSIRLVKQNWLNEIMDPAINISVEEDENGKIIEKITISERWSRLRSNEDLRNSIYKKNYTFNDVKLSLEKREILLSIWQMLNIYPENKDMIYSLLLHFDGWFPIEVLILNSFETYAYFDPRSVKIENNKLEIIRPDIITEGLKTVQSITENLLIYKNTKNID